MWLALSEQMAMSMPPTDPTLNRQAFVFVLVRGGCGRGANALPPHGELQSSLVRPVRDAPMGEFEDLCTMGMLTTNGYL
jgi:hypothetical protein